MDEVDGDTHRQQRNNMVRFQKRRSFPQPAALLMIALLFSSAAASPSQAQSHGHHSRPPQDGRHETAHNRGHSTHGNSRVITCDSNDHRLRRCNAAVNRNVRLLRQNSSAACIERRTWGWDRRGVWVSRGCRGQFQIN